MFQAQGAGSIEVICGPMFSGKTEEQLEELKEHKLQNKEFRFLNLLLIFDTMKEKL